jgi:hypothetical protein
MSYWKNEEKSQVNQFQTSISSVNGLSYNAGQRVDFEIPSSVKYIDGKSCYINLDVKLGLGDTLTKLVLDPVLGANCLIKNLRIFSNNGNRVLLEEIVDYNTKLRMEYDYNSDDSLRGLRAMKEGSLYANPENRCTLGCTTSNCVDTNSNPYFKTKIGNQIAADVWSNDDFLTAKCCINLHSGIFTKSQKIFPCLLTGGLYIEIDLEDAKFCIHQLDSAIRTRRAYHNPVFHGVNAAGGNWAANGTTATKEVFFKADNNITSVKNLPFCVGEKLAFCNGSNIDENAWLSSASGGAETTAINPVIDSITLDGGGLIKVGFSASVYNGSVAGHVGKNIVAGEFIAYSAAIDTANSIASTTLTAKSTYEASYVVSNIEFVLQQVELSSEDENTMLKNIREGGTIEFDILSCTNYKHSLLKENRQATVNLPLNNSKAKALAVIATDSTVYSSAQTIGAIGTYIQEKDANYATYAQDTVLHSNSTKLTGCIDFCTTFQMLVADKLTPSRPVNVSRINLGRSISAQQLTELDKMLNQSKITPRSFQEYNRNFIIPRSYVLQDGVMDLRNMTNQLQLVYNEATAPTVNKMLMCLVYHIRTIQIKGASINVVL